MKRILPLFLCLVLLAGLLVGCGETADQPVSPTQNQNDPPSAEPTPTPTQPPEPTEEPAPTLSQRAEGCWQLAFYEIEGSAGAVEDTADEYEVLRFLPDGTVDYLRASAYYDPTVENAVPVTETEDRLEFTVPLSYGPLEFLVTSADDETLEATVGVHYSDGTVAGGYRIYRRTDASALRDYPRPLSEAELYRLNSDWDSMIRSFFYCSYSRPEEIDWFEVLYDGAGINVELSAEERAYYEEWTGWPIELDMEAIRGDDLEAFVLQTTGTEYRLARKPLNWDYLAKYDLYCRQHGDTNAQTIEFEGGWRMGSDYYLYFQRDDWSTHREERWFCAHLRDTEDGWQYLAVWPDSALRPEELVTIDFYDEQPAADHVIDTAPLDSDQPFGWIWALATAQKNGVTVQMARSNPRSQAEYSMATGMGAAEPNELLGEYEMAAGETLAVRVLMTWYPYLRISASRGCLWGDYWFGSDNYLHLDDVGDQEIGLPPQHWIMGHDLDGEGRGANPWSEVDLVNFLTDADSYDNWFWYNESGELSAMLRFRDYRTLDIIALEEGYELFLYYDYLDHSSYEAPDLLIMEKYYEDDDWSVLPAGFFDGDALGSYQIRTEQLDGLQRLTLRQTGGGPCALGYLLGAPKTQTEFVFCRWVGASVD